MLLLASVNVFQNAILFSYYGTCLVHAYHDMGCLMGIYGESLKEELQGKIKQNKDYQSFTWGDLLSGPGCGPIDQNGTKTTNFRIRQTLGRLA